jgi:hypothetical protein
MAEAREQINSIIKNPKAATKSEFSQHTRCGASYFCCRGCARHFAHLRHHHAHGSDVAVAWSPGVAQNDWETATVQLS